MKPLRTILVEARSHEEQNTNLPATEVLRKYKDNKNIFINFSMDEKVGINPSSHTMVAHGIDAYPLRDSWIENNFDKLGVVGGLKSMRKYHYINILELKDKSGFLNNTHDYTTSDYAKDIKKIQHMLSKQDEPEFDKILSKLGEYDWNNEFGKLYRVAINMSYDTSGAFKSIMGSAPSNGRRCANILIALGYTGFSDRIKEDIGMKMGYDMMATFLSIKPFKHISTILNKDYDYGKRTKG